MCLCNAFATWQLIYEGQKFQTFWSNNKPQKSPTHVLILTKGTRADLTIYADSIKKSEQ